MTKIPSVEEKVEEFGKQFDELKMKPPKKSMPGLERELLKDFMRKALTAEREAGARQERQKCVAEMKTHKHNRKFITVNGTLQMMSMIELIETGALTPPTN